MEGLVGRSWTRMADLVALLGNFTREEFLLRAQGPYLLELPLEELAPSGPQRREDASTEDVRALFEHTRKREEPPEQTETQKVLRVPRFDDGTATFSTDDMLRLKRRRAEMRVAFVGAERRTTIGRTPECHLMVPGRAISRVHAAIEQAVDGRWTVVDLGSRNGTMLNGRRVAARTPTPLAAEEQVLQLGDWRCAVLFPRRLWETSRRTP